MNKFGCTICRRKGDWMKLSHKSAVAGCLVVLILTILVEDRITVNREDLLLASGNTYI